jgi:hypothetical protein
MQSQRIRRTIKTRKKLEDGEHEMGNWTLHKSGNRYELYHYNTCMLQWEDTSTYKPYDWSLWKSTGHGSTTDQQIVNAVLGELGVDLYFSRKGGSHYVSLDHPDVPSYRRKVLAT